MLLFACSLPGGNLLSGRKMTKQAATTTTKTRKAETVCKQETGNRDASSTAQWELASTRHQSVRRRPMPTTFTTFNRVPHRGSLPALTAMPMYVTNINSQLRPEACSTS